MLYKLIFKREAIFTMALTAVWLACSFLLDLYLGGPSSGILMHPKAELFALYLLIALASFFLNQVLRATKLSNNNDYSVMFLAAVLMSALGPAAISFQFLIGFLMTLLLVYKIQEGYNKTEDIFSEFEVGIIAGGLTIINPLFIVALPFTIVALINVKVNTWRGFFAVVLGFLFTLLLKWSYLLVFNYDHDFTQLLPLAFRPKEFSFEGLVEQLSTAVLLLVFVLSSNYFLRVSTKLNIKLRVFYKVWLWLSLFFLAGLLLFEHGLAWPQLFLCINLPILILYKMLINSFSRNIFKELFLLVLLAVSISLRF